MIQKRNGKDGRNLKKGKVVPVHSTKAHSRSKGIAPHVLDLGVKWWSVVNITLRPHQDRENKKGTQKIGGSLGPAWAVWRREKFLASTGNRTTDSILYNNNNNNNW